MPQNANGAGSIRKKTVKGKNEKASEPFDSKAFKWRRRRDSNWRSGLLSTVK